MSIIIGSKYVDEISELRDMGYDVITFEASDALHSEISYHADINVFRINNAIFINDDIKLSVGESISPFKTLYIKGIHSPYPDDIKLNCAIIGDKLLCNTKHVAKEILEYAQNNLIEVIHTNQGYSKCSVCVVNDKAVITSDEGITSLLKNYQIDVLKISEGNIRLSDNHYGFIGGASGRLSYNELYFSGDISSHPDYEMIIDFLNKYSVKPVFNKNRPLTDFGGFITI